MCSIILLSQQGVYPPSHILQGDEEPLPEIKVDEA